MSYVHLCCGLFVVLWLNAGVGAPVIIALPSAAKVAILGVWVLLAVARSPAFLRTIILNAWPLVLMLLIAVLYGAAVTQSEQNIQGFGYLLIAFALGCFYATPRFVRERHVLLAAVAADLVITGVRTFMAVQESPLLARYLATTESKRTAVYGSQSFAGLGGYGYAYSLTAVLLVLLYFLVRSRRARLPLGLLVVAGSVILFELAFTTAIVLLLAGGAAFLAWDVVSRRELKFVLFAAALLGWFTGLYAAILNYLAGQTWVTAAVGERLDDLSAFLSGDVSSGSDLGIRFSRWSLSLQTFWSSGPFGLAGGGSTPLTQGDHSQWLDLLASYGVSVVLVGVFLVLAWRVAKAEATPAEVGSLKRVWAYFVVLGVVNPLLFAPIALTWMFVVPALVGWLAATTSSGGGLGGEEASQSRSKPLGRSPVRPRSRSLAR